MNEPIVPTVLIANKNRVAVKEKLRSLKNARSWISVGAAGLVVGSWMTTGETSQTLSTAVTIGLLFWVTAEALVRRKQKQLIDMENKFVTDFGGKKEGEKMAQLDAVASKNAKSYAIAYTTVLATATAVAAIVQNAFDLNQSLTVGATVAVVMLSDHFGLKKYTESVADAKDERSTIVDSVVRRRLKNEEAAPSAAKIKM